MKFFNFLSTFLIMSVFM